MPHPSPDPRAVPRSDGVRAGRVPWRRFADQPANVQGALWVIASAVLFSCMGGLIKTLGSDFASHQLGFFRALFGWMSIWPFIVRFGIAGLRTGRPSLHLLRGLFGGGAMLCGFYAVTHLVFADAIAISYARTLFLIPLAVLLLGETVQIRRWTATGIGFAGVLVIVEPTGAVETATLVAVLGALLAAGATTSMKRLSGTERTETMLFYFGLITTLVTLAPALTVWRTPGWGELALMLLMGACGGAGQYCIVRGLRVGETTAIIPFDYLRLLLAGVIGYVAFAELPGLNTFAGAALIVAATLYIALREAQLARRRRAAATPDPRPADAAPPPPPPPGGGP